MSVGRGIVLVLAVTCLGGCSSQDDANRIRVEGSDTMINLAVAWSETYMKNNAEISIEVSGSGSGIGIKNLAENDCDIANSSREMEPEEIELTKANTGSEPVEHIVGYDALAVYVHKNNPIDSISLEELAEIYGDGSTITNWNQIDPSYQGEISVVSRQNSSGTYKYFQDAIMGNRKYRLGTLDQSGSKDVVELVSKTPSAIGYSGMGYHRPGEVKMLKISKVKGEPGVVPSLETARDSSYAITRPLLCYTAGEPTGATKAYLDWIKTADDAQAILKDQGYVPLVPGGGE